MDQQEKRAEEYLRKQQIEMNREIRTERAESTERTVSPELSLLESCQALEVKAYNLRLTAKPRNKERFA